MGTQTIEPRARQPLPQGARMAEADRGMLDQGADLAGGALDLARLTGWAPPRADAEAALGSSARSTTGRLGIDVPELVNSLGDDHIALQAARLYLAATAAASAVDVDDAEQAQLAARAAALLTDENALVRERAIAEHEQKVKEANRRGIEAPRMERPEHVPQGARFTRPIVVDMRRIKSGPAAPAGYLEPHEHALLAITERRTTLQAERRDLGRLIAAARARMLATMTEVADLVEAVYEGCQSVPPERADLGPAYSTWCKLAALTTEAYASTTWDRAVDHWQQQIADAT